MEKFRIDNNQEILFQEGNFEIITNGIIEKPNPKSLFKYFTLNENNLNALENGYFHLSNPKDFNDPLDCNRNLIIENQKELQDWQYIESLNNNLTKGISCFSENGLHPLMWGHYTNSYRGFNIKLKRDHILSMNNDFNKILKVIYSDYPKSISEKSDFARLYQFIIKLEDWKYENEWRLIIDNPEKISNKFKYNIDAIEEISIGYQLFDTRNVNENSLRDKFTDLLNNKFPHIPFYTVGPHQTEFKIEKMKFKFGTVEDLMKRFK